MMNEIPPKTEINQSQEVNTQNVQNTQSGNQIQKEDKTKKSIRLFISNKFLKYLLALFIFLAIATIFLVSVFLPKRQQPKMQPSPGNSTKTSLINTSSAKLDAIEFHLDDTFSENAWVEISPAPPTDIPRIAYGVGLTYEFRVYRDQTKAEPLSNFDIPFTATLDYRKYDIEDISENTLSLYWLDEQKNEWQKLDTKLQTENKLAIAKFNKVGKFALLGELKTPPPPIGYAKIKYPLTEWKTYSDQQSGFSIKYPPNWQITKSQTSTSEAFYLTVDGDRQAETREGTGGLIDGAKLIFSTPIVTDTDLDTWYRENLNQVTENDLEIQHSKEKFGLYTFYARRVCGLDCNVIYVTQNNQNIYQMYLFTAGPDSDFFLEKAEEILATFTVL